MFVWLVIGKCVNFFCHLTRSKLEMTKKKLKNASRTSKNALQNKKKIVKM